MTTKLISIIITVFVIFSCGNTMSYKQVSKSTVNPIPSMSLPSDILDDTGLTIDSLASVPIEIPSHRYFVNYESLATPYESIIVMPQEGLMHLLSFGDTIVEIEEPKEYTGLMKKDSLRPKKAFNWKTHEGIIILANLLETVEELDLDDLLLNSVKYNADPGAIYYLVKEGADPNYNKYSLLYLATLENNTSVIKLLTQLGAENTGSAEFICKTQIELYKETISVIRSTTNIH